MRKLIKKLKGFTLIELLAVIVILAIIALIAVPLILNIIEDSRIKSAVVSGSNYVKAVNYKIAQDEMKGRLTPLGEYVIGENELEVDASNIENITGSYEVGSKGVLVAGLCVNRYSVEYSNGKAYYKKDVNYCEDAYVFEEPDAELLSNVCKNNSLYNEKSKFKIYTVEDLACFSNLVNGGKNFSGKEVYLLKDVNFNDNSSYKNINTQDYGDINGNNTVEGLKDEVTTGAGFKPIGNNSNKFAGTFLGYGFTISNLMINRTTDYIGLFGYNNGTINGVVLKNINVTGGYYVGSIAGYNNKTIKNISTKGNVTGTGSYVGGIVGAGDSSNGTSKSLMYSGYVKGKNDVGGLIGQGWNTEGAVYDSTLETTYTSTSSIGYCAGGGSASCKRNKVTLKTKSNRYTNAPDGSPLSSESLRLNMIDGLVDTYIGGDNDSDGYYFDYDSENNITVYSTARRPIQNKLKGEGTEEKPYIINSMKNWKMATATVTQGKYYSITSDLDFGNDLLYAFGTSSNKFNGNLNGNMNTLKNINVEGYDYIGVIGYNNGTVKGIKFDNITVTGVSNYVGIIGYNNATINGVMATNLNVTGDYHVGGLVGLNNNTIKNVSIKGNVTGANNYVGGVVGSGDSTNGVSKGLMYSGYVKGKNDVGGLIGQGWNTEGAVYDSTLETTYTATSSIGYCAGGGSASCMRNGVTLKTKTNRYTNAPDGSPLSSESLRLNMIDGLVDTYIGGDNDNDGFYFDYDNDKNIVVYSTAKTPIKNTLSGDGTSSSPYLIKNTSDWKMATATVTKEKYYSITSNLDFDGDLLYTFGTNANKFNGNLNGNMNTLSNINVEGYDYVGVFGYNNGTIKGIRFDDVTVTGVSNYVGIIGYNNSVVNGIAATGVNIKGDYHVGGLVGLNNKTIMNASVIGNVTGENNYIGGVVGSGDSTNGISKSLMYSGYVKGKNYVGGLIGQGWNTEGAVYDSTLETTYTSTSSLAYCTASGSANCKRKNVNLVMKTNRSGGSDGVLVSNTKLRLNMIDGLVDTYIGGDNNSDGYYFDYDNNKNITVYSTAKTPIQNTLSGAGTSASPYIISNTNDWKMATATVTQGKYYSITSDLDFGNDLLYAMGTSSNKFNGNLNGNMNTLKNISVEGYDYIGVVGYNSGTIKGIKFDNINSKAVYQYAGIVGYNDGTVNGIAAKNLTVTGDYYVGGLAGYNNKTIKNIDIRGNVTGSNNYIGGIVGGGDSTNGSARSLIYSGYVKGKNYVGGLIGQGWNTEGAVYDSTLETTYSSTSSLAYCTASGSANCKRKSVNLVMKTNRSGGSDGVLVSNAKLRLNMIDGLVDTYIAGDNDLDGYYFDYDNSNNITVYSTAKTPIQNTLSGAGTQASPYQIKNLNDWKIATSTATQNKYYSITSDIDFGNDLLYAMGTSSNKFNGNLNGNAHTLSNINVEGYDYVGFIGYNNGTVRGIRFSNPTVKGVYQYVGVIGYNNGTLNGITIRGLNVSGDYYVGGLTGYNNNTIKTVDVRGTITASNSYVGGVIGATNSTNTSATGAVFKGSVTAKNYVGGLVGQGWSTDGVVYDSTLETTYSSTSSLAKCTASGSSNCKNKNITLKMKTNRSGGSDGTNISEITTANVSDKLDTTDSDSDGYYFTVVDSEIQLAYAN